MGVNLTINSYKKEQSCIVGQISFLGFYEVKLDSMEKFSINKGPIHHYHSIYLITELTGKNLESFGLYNEDLLFYHFASNFWSGQSLGNHEDETTGLMYDPKKLLGPLTRLISAKDYILDSFKGTGKEFIVKDIDDYKEIDFLIKFKELVEDAIEKDGIVGITFS
jgi:hypothetical protein